MAVKPAQGSGIGMVTTPYPEYGGPMALQAGLRAAEPQYAEQITGGIQDYTGGLTGGIIDIISGLVSASTDPRLRAVQDKEPSFVAPKIPQMTPKEVSQMEIDEGPSGLSEELSSLATRLAEQKQVPKLGSFQAGADTVEQLVPGQEIIEDKKPQMTQEGLEQVTTMALQDYLDQARPGTQPKDYAEYIKEFSDATGLDVSGKPDKSTALMALGLSLMQNKAGKGFDVGKMLGAVGEAGEAALPEYQKAKSEARALRAKAGEYALGRRKEDEAKAQQRNFMYVVPKEGKGDTELERFQNRMMRGKYIRVNAAEQVALDENEAFNRQFEFLPPNALTNMKDMFKAPESPYSDKMTDYQLFGGADTDFTVKTYAPKPGKTNLPSQAVSASEIERVERNIQSGLESADRLDEKFSEFGQRFSKTPPTLFNQVGSSIIQFGQAMGVGLPDDYADFKDIEDDVAYQKRFTEYLATRYAPQILQEAGKTISDADRQRVQQIVGEIGLLKSPAQVAARMQDLHEFIVLAQRRNMENAIVGLNSVGGNMRPPKLTAEQVARYNQLVSRYKPGAAFNQIEESYGDSITPEPKTQENDKNE